MNRPQQGSFYRIMRNALPILTVVFWVAAATFAVLLVVDTEGLVLKAKVHSAKIPEQDGLRLLLESARGGILRPSQRWLDAEYEGRGKRWVEETMGLDVEIVRKPVPEKVLRRFGPRNGPRRAERSTGRG